MRPTKAHPDAGAEGVSATACDRRHTHRSTEIIYARSGAAEKAPESRPEPGFRRSRRLLDQGPTFICKLKSGRWRSCAFWSPSHCHPRALFGEH